MRKKVLLTGVMMAAMLAISACGSKNTAETTTTAEMTTAVETTAEETTTAESPVTPEGEESETAGELTAEQIKSFAEEIQGAVAAQDIGWLADLAAYPVFVSLEAGEGSEIQSVEEFMALGEDKVFTETLLTQIADVDPEGLEVFGAGVIMGEDVNITFNNVDGEPKITGINL